MIYCKWKFFLPKSPKKSTVNMFFTDGRTIVLIFLLFLHALLRDTQQVQEILSLAFAVLYKMCISRSLVYGSFSNFTQTNLSSTDKTLKKEGFLCRF